MRTARRLSLIHIFIIIAFLIYYMLVWIKNTRAWMLLRGLMVILLFVLLAALFQMNTIIWIARNTLNVLVIALVVIFQPEMRKALENLGRKNVLAFLFSFDSSKEDTGKFSDKTINEMVKACYEMGKVKTGAMIVVEDETVLSDYESDGIAVDGILTVSYTHLMLTKIFRQASTSDIIVNAHKINQGEEVTLDNKSMDFFFLKRYDADVIISVVLQLIKQKLPKFVDATPYDIQVLTPMQMCIRDRSLRREHRKRWRRYRSPTPDSMSRNIWENSGNKEKALDANVENTQHTVPFLTTDVLTSAVREML